ncbi:MAG: MgtC/SapB family protein [Rhodoferax sp.]|nr:MgtC/SapB family protein [Rhodoferax sp.]MCP5259836.1 MgtC/SapB family protein [Rhodoferax sp.]
MGPLDEILVALRSEFSDLAEIGEATRIAVRILLAGLLGALLGANRERHGKAAGLRTHMLVAMGSAAFVIAPLFAGMEIADQSRVIQGVIAGIGFLGAGTIIKHSRDEEVVGLTTAASVWMTSAIGVACGLGRDATAIILALLAWVVLHLVEALSRWAATSRRS